MLIKLHIHHDSKEKTSAVQWEKHTEREEQGRNHKEETSSKTSETQQSHTHQTETQVEEMHSNLKIDGVNSAGDTEEPPYEEDLSEWKKPRKEFPTGDMFFIANTSGPRMKGRMEKDWSAL